MLFFNANFICYYFYPTKKREEPLFYKKFPHPPRTSYLLPRTCLFVGKNAVVRNVFALYEKAMCSIHSLCSPRSTPTWPFDVKPPTYEPIGLIPTRESSVLFEIILHQALKQTGETTRACRFCLQVLNFLQTEGRSAFYRKFLRISSIKDLWAMTRRH